MVNELNESSCSVLGTGEGISRPISPPQTGNQREPPVATNPTKYGYASESPTATDVKTLVTLYNSFNNSTNQSFNSSQTNLVILNNSNLVNNPQNSNNSNSNPIDISGADARADSPLPIAGAADTVQAIINISSINVIPDNSTLKHTPIHNNSIQIISTNHYNNNRNINNNNNSNNNSNNSKMPTLSSIAGDNDRNNNNNNDIYGHRYSADTKRIYNFTMIELPGEVQSILNLDSNFGFPTSNDKLPLVNIIKDLEGCVNGVKDDQLSNDQLSEWRNNLRTRGVNIVINYIKNRRVIKRNQKRHSRFIKNIRVTKKFLTLQKELLVMRSDIGNSTVVMYREEYQREMNKRVNDEETYQKTGRDPTLTAGLGHQINQKHSGERPD
ncbi:putative mediator of RNA polymerase II transcription subunit 26 [Cotesia glomerata]|uniref:putative mediator of RNA polymerase II transcription subunit 26 n=1 Tax=Cotesia glomerata TaxID=32391 RepID=UPI001D00D7A3|nr:putative mediator of RNA polymerase II transcription subunit 26 [Cotesia glomerata]